MSDTDGSHTGDSDPRLELGIEIRKEVLGAAHVERSMAEVSDFSRPMQEYVTRACWGDVWSRPGLDRRTRSLLNLVMLTVLNRSHELGVHVRGAITNGVSVAEIQETLLHASVYCGVPAGLEAFRVAEEVLGELGVATTAGPGR